jgi:hypothetical protein
MICSPTEELSDRQHQTKKKNKNQIITIAILARKEQLLKLVYLQLKTSLNFSEDKV